MTRIVFIAVFLLASAPALADVLIIDEVRQVERMDLPVNGQSKQAIESKFGTPDQKHSAVGDPPISRWDYGRYSVYFEYDRVLFSVLHPGNVIERS
ncbi:MAG: phosphodiesterase [Xanthomonadales bacterium]|nr:phosphodiesterase [Xanthomonadales bacterium]